MSAEATLEEVTGAYPTHTVKVTIDGKEQEHEIQIRQVKVRQLAKMLKTVAKFSGFIETVKASGQKMSPIDMMAFAMDDFTDLVAVMADLPAATIGEMEVDDLVELAEALLGSNVDFFTRSVAPLLSKAMEVLSSEANQKVEVANAPAKTGPMESTS